MENNRSTNLEDQTDSFMHLILHIDEGEDLELKVPTFFDSITTKWIGTIKLPKSKKLITASGKDSFELQNSFNKELHKFFTD